MTTVPDMVCRHCQEPLTRYRPRDEAGGDRWLHPGGTVRDHVAEPIPRAEATKVRMVCDFCSAPEPVWTYHTKKELRGTLAVPTYTGREDRRRISRDWYSLSAEQGKPDERIQHVSSTGRAACAECAGFIELRDMERLITYVRKVGPRPMGRMPRGHFRDLYREFFRSISHREQIRTPNS